MTIPPLLTAYARLTGRGGSKLIKMIIDTGANSTIIPPETALLIGCSFASEKRVPMLTAGNLMYLRVVSLPAITCLAQTVRNLEVLCHALPDESSVQGILGLDFLRHVPAFQEFEKKILELTRL